MMKSMITNQQNNVRTYSWNMFSSVRFNLPESYDSLCADTAKLHGYIEPSIGRLRYLQLC